MKADRTVTSPSLRHCGVTLWAGYRIDVRMMGQGWGGRTAPAGQGVGETSVVPSWLRASF